MKRFGHVLATAALISPLSVLAETICEPTPDGAVCVQPQKYCVSILSNECEVVHSIPVSAKSGMGLATLVLPYNAPPPVEHTQAVCDITPGGYSCYAAPLNGGVTYTWAVAGQVQFVNPPYFGDAAHVTCSPGATNIIYLTVTSPFALSTTVSTPLYCGYLGEW